MRYHIAATIGLSDDVAFIHMLAYAQTLNGTCMSVSRDAAVINVNHYLIATNVGMSDRNHGTAVTRTDYSSHRVSDVFTLMNATASNWLNRAEWVSHNRIVGRPSRQTEWIPKVWWAIVHVDIKIDVAASKASRVFAEESANALVVVSGAVVIEARFGVRFARSVPERIDQRASRRRQIAE